MESFPIEAVPEAGLVHIACYTGVNNASALKERLQAQDKTLAIGLVESNLILDMFQLLVAATKAALDERAGKLRTNSVNAEIVYNLSPTNNIAESLRRFGISDSTTSLMAISIGGEAAAVLEEMNKTVDGTLTSFSDLEQGTDLATLRKYFKIDPKVTDKAQVLDWIIGAMAMKNVL
ncbi:hypothetical protein DFQ27_002021 [Actinomortierella ambigua]|uniref:EKC/KEOPS complex subunit CGI121 n=1 Tax=Actinomortierella ambigua TaxID=1343610 RepID=A0A9P6QD33_9FUNG|nr:hypothetical protein DFQ26_004003 [Actinomortierella ambigua]KAG0262954.1 hypothetical protein DFQ27_002021 [Actinomortierella ambigua]